jgi:hypothetical protein
VKLSPELVGSSATTVDEESGDKEARAGVVDGADLKMAPFAVTVLLVK